jgi:hypothetical protein
MKIQFIVTVCLLCIAGISVKGNPYQKDSLNTAKSEVSYGFEADACNKYIWRGLVYNNGFVVQPYGWLTYRDVTFGLWSNITLYDMNNSIKRNEVDLILSYNTSLLKFDIESSFMYYIYPHQSDSPPTGEFYLGVDYPFGDFKIISNFSIDVIKYPGACFAEAGVNYDKTLTKGLSLSSSLSLGLGSGKFNDTYVGISKTTLSMITGNLSLTYYPLTYIYFQPHVQVNKILDKNLYIYLEKYPVFYGLLIGIEF